MTIAIGALWPWARLASLAGLRENPPPRATILIADSRWTFLYPGGRPSDYSDVGTKLFRIAKDAGAVYAGDVDSGEECLARLARRFEKRRVKLPVTRMARDLFRAVYSRHHPGHPLGIFLGACSDRGDPELWYFDDSSDFEPVPLVGLNLLAFPETEKTFRAGLEYEKHIIRSGQPAEPIDGALWLIAALKEHVIDKDVDPSVGGKIQCAVIDGGGFQPIGISGSADTGTTWQPISPRAGELKTFRPRKIRGPRAQVGLHKVMD